TTFRGHLSRTRLVKVIDCDHTRIFHIAVQVHHMARAHAARANHTNRYINHPSLPFSTAIYSALYSYWLLRVPDTIGLHAARAPPPRRSWLLPRGPRPADPVASTPHGIARLTALHPTRSHERHRGCPGGE